jgi:hypothetical protein
MINEPLAIGYLLIEGATALEVLQSLNIKDHSIRDRIRKKIYQIAFELFVAMEEVSLVNIWEKCVEKKICNSTYLINLTEYYLELRDKIKKDSMDFGNPYCPWPRRQDEAMVDMLMDALPKPQEPQSSSPPDASPTQ